MGSPIRLRRALTHNRLRGARVGALEAYVAVVTATGLAMLAVLAGGGARNALDAGDTALAILFVALLAAELFPVRVPGHQAEASLATTFGLTVLMTHDLATVALLHAIALVVADGARRQQLVKILFNVSQISLSWGAAAGVLSLAARGLAPAGGAEYLSVQGAVALAGAASAFLLVNVVLAGIPPALVDGKRPLDYVREDFAFQSRSTAVLAAFAPVVLELALRAPMLLPLLAFPLAAIQRGAHHAVLAQHRSWHDALTGLPNRAHVTSELRAALVSRTPLAVVALDIGGLREINDTLGHDQGDVVLREVAQRLAAAEEGVAYLNGDDFVVVLRDVEEHEAIARTERLLQTMDGPVHLGQLELDVRIRAGIACHPAHGDDEAVLLRRADAALHRAKESRSAWELHDAAIAEPGLEQLARAGDLRRGIDSGALVLHYQPKVDIRTGRPAGVEALVRWQHPKLGLLGPSAFVELAEQTGLIRPLTLWVARTAAAQADAWRAAGLDLPVAVNLSARCLDSALGDELIALVDGDAVPRLELEVTETVMARAEEVLPVLERLAARGFRIALDDFGTGYSSLAYLKRLPVTEIKIDRSFVCDMDLDDDDRSIVRSMIELADSLGLGVVAEGVERAETLQALADLGCQVAQGYLISRPVPAAEATSWAQRFAVAAG